jgi:hypothetical protein
VIIAWPHLPRGFSEATLKTTFHVNQLRFTQSHPREMSQLMPRFTRVPTTLYRIQSQPTVMLRDHQVQMALGRTSYDLKLVDQLVHPLPLKSHFHTPNGMSLRPVGPNMLSILERFRGTPTIYTLGCGLELPENLCIFHEHSDHYSLQTTVPMSLEEFNQSLTQFLGTLPRQSKEQFLEQMMDDNDQDN